MDDNNTNTNTTSSSGDDLNQIKQELAALQATLTSLQKDKEDESIKLQAQTEISKKLETENATLKEEIASVKKTNFILSQQGNGTPQLTAEEAIADMFGLRKKGEK